MSDASLDPLFSPRSIAIVGASDTPSRIGGVPVDLLKRMGWAGRVLPINPKSATVQGLPAFASLRDVGEPIDLAVFAVPQSAIDAAMDDAVAAGVRAAVVFTAGFAEVGGDGVAAQARLAARAREAGIRVVGPNCLGVMNCRERMYATFSPAPGIGVARPGSIGLVSQSGAFGAYAYSLARDRGIGLSVWASTGNEADVQVADVIAWMARDPHTSVIMAYIEGVRDGDRMRRALADAHAARKPVVVVKVGRTALGAQAAASHTASLAGDDAVYDALFRQYGVYRARDIEEFFNVAHGAAVAGLPRNDRIALFTLSGGVGAFMADEAATVGLDVAETAPAVQAEILSWVPFAAPRNPIDITGQVSQDPSLIERATRAVLGAGDYGAWLGFMAAAGAGNALWPVFQSLAEGLRRDHPGTLIAISTLFSPERRDRLAELGCLSFAEPADAVRTIGALARIGAALSRPVPPAIGDAPPASLRLAPGALDEPASLALLASHGVPTIDARVARDAAEAARIAVSVGTGARWAIKVVSPDLLHKTDVGGVKLGVAPGDAAAAFDAVTSAARDARPDARIDGALLAPMVAGGVECILGARVDPVFGPVVMFGLGGAFVEVLRDVSIRVAPITREDALAMIREVRAFPLLDGARGRPRCDLEALADALLALARLAMDARGTLESIDVNPFVVFARGAGPGGASALALDAVVIGRAAGPEGPR
ncbi:MAG: acetate--CoA ligase family protein [Burkholderiaceae bacterium]|jgi:acyl-CoA synthetase (NDP forming)|nr:acetate--CoA ligase family protein [Burkholderiales bacterium]MCZ8337951.1 acetate--CoA ligase family protein [Burkholderiaceae bacterium]